MMAHDDTSASVLDLRREAVRIDPSPKLECVPFTIELRAKPRAKSEWLVVNMAADPSRSWALFVGEEGDMAACLGATDGKWCFTAGNILDGAWHDLALTFDGEQPAFFVDGRPCPFHQPDGNRGRKLRFPPGLQIGTTPETQILGSSAALIQAVKLSSGIRTNPDALLEVDADTIGLWRADRQDEFGNLPDLAGENAAGRVVVLPEPCSLDEIERRSFQAGPAPMEGPVEDLALNPGSLSAIETAPQALLDGTWEMIEGGEEIERLGRPWEDFIPAEVPGSVHGALERAGRIPDPKFALNDAFAREKSASAWWFRRRFPRPAGTGHRLTFDGVAVQCTVWLNGTKLGSHDGMFGGPSFDVAGLLAEENELVARLEPIPQIISTGDWKENISWRRTVVFNNVYGWHYSHIPALGLWRSVRLEAAPAVRLLDPFIVTRHAQAGLMQLRVDLRGPSTGWRGTLFGCIEPENFEGAPLRFERPIESAAADFCGRYELTIPDPQLWWPNAHGKPNLYRLTTQFVPETGPGAQTSTTFGIRTIEMAPQADGPTAAEYNWVFVINKRPLFVNGTGWCTMDSSMDFRRERYRRFLEAARDQHCQMVRAWGSGMPETDDFYDLCDRLGLMVMQEWPVAWNSHEDQPYDALEETVRLNTLRLRNRASLVMWGGGNESNDPFGPAIDMMGRLAIELDGTRPFHRTEAWGGSTHNYNCWWNRAHLDFNLRMTSRFFGEFGLASMPVWESVQCYLPDGEKSLWPPKPGGVFEYHTPIFNRWGEMERFWQYAGYFTAGTTMQRFILGTQLAQVVGVRHTLERARTRWPECTGALMYKLNDNYPAGSWSTLDWYGAAKPAHWFVQDAFAPLHACVLFDTVNLQGAAAALPVFLLDDSGRLGNGAWRVAVRAYDGSLQRMHEQAFERSGPVDRVLRLGEFMLSAEQTASAPLLVVCELEVGEQVVDRTFYFVNYEARKDSLFELPRTTLVYAVDAGRVIITNTDRLPAVAVNVFDVANLDSFTADENYFWLEPGESRAVAVNSVEQLRVEAWNA